MKSFLLTKHGFLNSPVAKKSIPFKVFAKQVEVARLDWPGSTFYKNKHVFIFFGERNQIAISDAPKITDGFACMVGYADFVNVNVNTYRLSGAMIARDETFPVPCAIVISL